MLTKQILDSIIDRVEYREWMFATGPLGDGWFIAVRFADDAGEIQHGRKWHVSTHACLSEVVQTCLKAVLTAIEHEAREQFQFDGEAIFGPHYDVTALKGLPHETRKAA